ncbi:hypothetical protein [Actinoallomurus iriomotensis]|nr:hypothetical protein [Actinoallomurus iriomotensis]
MDEKILRMARDLPPNPDNSIAAIAKMLGAGPAGTVRHLDLGERRRGPGHRRRRTKRAVRRR